MSKDIKIKKGLNIPMKGEADKVLGTVERSSTFVVKPTDFKNFTPKLLVREGDEVLAGSPLFFNKQYPDVKIGSPVSGEVVEVVRGAKRKILGIKILADKETRYAEFTAADAASTDLSLSYPVCYSVCYAVCSFPSTIFAILFDLLLIPV